ncbi:MAG: twin-arginine translocation signal domain-containing protein [Candidatus Levybacteria bacterium]|nr:twin-arginine translocation signal domain-containing protein [Candidatus Levybacteria bacterium]
MPADMKENVANILDTRLSRRDLLKTAGAAVVSAAVFGKLPDIASAKQAEPTPTYVPLPTPEVQKEQYGYEIGYENENSPFGNVTLCIEKNLFEAPTNWMHAIDLNTDPETGFPDAVDRLNNAIRLGMYRGWQSNKPESRADVTFDEWVTKLEAGDNVKFRAKGRKGTEPVPEEITIDPADPVRLVWLGLPGHALYSKYSGHSEGFTSGNGETRLEFWTNHYDVPGNGDYSGDREQYQMHKFQASEFLGFALTIMSVPELQEQKSITAEQEQKYLVDPDGRMAEFRKLFFTLNSEGTNVANHIFNVS